MGRKNAARRFTMEDPSFNLIDHNARIFFKPKLASWYAGEPLAAAEAIILIRHRDAFAGKSVLDIGVGSGRTTRYLLPFAAHYLGTDVSPPMIALYRKNWPAAELAELDMRDLAKLHPRQFDFILASSGVFDVLTHEARLQALSDCAALLAPQGYLVFSGHNRRYKRAGLPPKLEFSGSKIRWPLTVARFVRDNINHHKMKQFEQHKDDYALLNDIAHGFQSVFYYTDRATQTDQIAAAGLALIDVFGDDGRLLQDDEDDREDGLLFYVCQKHR
jgi:SAM-dependent methyltransferase